MAKKTKTQKLIESLEKMGCKEVKGKSKYRQFTIPGRDNEFYFVGSRAALRVGRIASKSFSISHRVNDIIKKWEEK